MSLRPQRTDAPVVAVTGATDGLGRALVERLAGAEHLGGLVGIDLDVAPAPFPRTPVFPRVDGVVWRCGSADDVSLRACLQAVDTVVHLATTYDLSLPAARRRPANVRGTARVLEASRETGVRRVVLVTSAEVWGARPGGPLPLADDAPLTADGDDDTLLSDLVEVERLAAHAVRTGLAVTVLRPATLVAGPLGPAYDGQVLRQLGAPRLLALRGVEPLWQLCHSADLVAALEVAVLRDLTGGYGVAADGCLPQTRVEQLSGRSRLELPAAVALSTAERLRRLGLTTSSPRELEHLLAPLVIACDGLRAAGWRPAWTNEQALLAHLASRWQDRRGTAGTAAGATAALLGTAAVLRTRRRRHRR